jgi:hypothetical protein
MSTPLTVEAALVEWGERLFCPANRIVRPSRSAARVVRRATRCSDRTAVRHRRVHLAIPPVLSTPR